MDKDGFVWIKMNAQSGSISIGITATKEDKSA